MERIITIAPNMPHDLTLATLSGSDHMLEPSQAERVAELFKALADPTRVRMIGLLAHYELCVGDLATLMGMSQPATSHQLRILRTMRIVRARREGKCVFYQLDDDHIHHILLDGLAHADHE